MANFGSMATARWKRGVPEAASSDTSAFIPVLYALRASSDGVVASASGVECRSTVARDSPNLRSELSRDLTERVQDIFSPRNLYLLLINRVPEVQFLARKPRTYWLPRLAMEPSRTRALAVRSQICCATSDVSRACFGLSHQRQLLLDLAIRKQIQERRLLQLHRQSLAQRVVEHRVTGPCCRNPRGRWCPCR